MFGELKSMMGLLGKGGKIQEEVQKLHAHIGTLTAEATAGGGMVTVKANGRLQLVSVSISPDALGLNDREMLEDLIVAAANQALGKVQEQVGQETAKMAAGLGLPPGMLGGGFPGLG